MPELPREAGSLTIIGTALVQTNSKADEAIFQRRALAVEKERAIQENELQNRIELARRQSEFAERNTKKFVNLWKKLGLSHDGWAATTDERHKRCVQKILTDLHDRGQLYKKAYCGHYSVRQEQFLSDKDRGEDGNFGPEWGEVIELEEENWWFKLSDHVDWLRGAIESGAFGVLPDFRRTEVHREGQPVTLSAKEFQLLRYFIEHRGDTLSRYRQRALFGNDLRLGGSGD